MIRLTIAAVLAMGWCIAHLAPEEQAPDPDAPPDVMPASCVPPTADPGGYDPVLYAGAGRVILTHTVRAAIAQDDLAALRYLISAVRRAGVQPGLPLASRSRPLLHALNALTARPDRGRLSAAYLTTLYTQYGPDAALAVALARRHTQPDPVLAALLDRDGASVLGLMHISHCAQLAAMPDLKAQCGHPLARREVRVIGQQETLTWPSEWDERLPGCESDPQLAERLLERQPAWQASAASEDPVWLACYAGLAEHLEQRGAAGGCKWHYWTFEHALLALSPSVGARSQVAACSCLGLSVYHVDAHPRLEPPL